MFKDNSYKHVRTVWTCKLYVSSSRIYELQNLQWPSDDRVTFKRNDNSTLFFKMNCYFNAINLIYCLQSAKGFTTTSVTSS